MKEEQAWDGSPGPAWGLGSALEAFGWEQARAEVEEECQGRIAIVGLKGAGKTSLLNQLRGWEVPAADGNGQVDGMFREDLGFFVLVNLPGDNEGGRVAFDPDLVDPDGGTWATLTEAKLILFLLDGELLGRPQRAQPGECQRAGAPCVEVNLRPAEYQWFCRVRSLGRPLVVALNKVDLLEGRGDELRAELERRLAGAVLPISAREGTGIEAGLLPRLLAACPELTVPLGREMPVIRRRAANQIIRRTTLLSALTGLEPLPLLDIPIQLAAQMRMLLKLAALHGRLEPGDGSREMLAAVAGGLGVRLAAQQAAKLMPVLGWVASGLLSGLTTWLLGQAAVAYLSRSLEDRLGVWQRLRRDGGPAAGQVRQDEEEIEPCTWKHRFRLPLRRNGWNHLSSPVQEVVDGVDPGAGH
jgi:uncharacterized protein (DUF697 family)